jgi:hypothetical protein
MGRIGRVVAALTLVLGIAIVTPGAAAPAHAATANALSGPLALASVTSAGVKGSSSSRSPSLSASGTVVAFDSLSPNLSPDDTDFNGDIFLRDLTNSRITLASTSSAGVKGNNDSLGPAMNGDGTVVAFTSTATNLDPGDTDGLGDVYIKDLASGDLTLASTSDGGSKGNDASSASGLSRDGTRVVFESQATNLDPGDADGIDDIYVKDVTTGDLTLASATKSGVKGNGISARPAISANGRRAAFDSTSDNLVGADSDTNQDVYVKIVATGKLLLVSRSATGAKGNRFSHEPSLSGNGLKVAFASAATNLDPADTDTAEDIFIKNIPTGAVQLASTSDTGVKGNDSSIFPVLSGDGKHVVFISRATNLDPADTTSDWDVYDKNLNTGDILLVTATAKGVHGNQTNQAFTSISGAGKLTAFESNATNLDGDDTDAVQDIYVKNSTICTIAGTSADESLAGTSGDDVICGEGGNDTINATGGDDILFGGNGTDLLVGGPGADAMNADGLDQLGYPDSDEGVTVDLGAHTASGGDAEGDTWTGVVESVEGSNAADTLIGDAQTNLLLGFGDDDVLAGAGGGDALIGGSGTDLADYRTSPEAVAVDLALDTVDGGDAEDDSIFAIEGSIGSGFDDTFLGDSEDNVFEGMAGADTIDGGTGVDRADYELSGAAVSINLNDGTFSGGDADGDLLSAIEDVTGSLFGDTLIGDNGPNTLSGLDDDDTLKGKNGDDTLIGAGGTDTFDGGGGTDSCDDTGGESATQCEP